MYICLMTQDEKLALLEKLKSERQKLREALVLLEEVTQPIKPENSLGRLSRMDAIQNKSVAEYSLRQTRDKIKSIDYWLSRQDTADFGRCTHCKNPIMIKRLLYMPSNLKCMRCASR